MAGNPRPAIFWLSEERAHDRSMISKVNTSHGPVAPIFDGIYVLWNYIELS